VEQSTPII